MHYHVEVVAFLPRDPLHDVKPVTCRPLQREVKEIDSLGMRQAFDAQKTGNVVFLGHAQPHEQLFYSIHPFVKRDPVPQWG